MSSPFVEAGRRGARRRWGPPRVARLDALSPEQRALVLALIAAAEASNKVPTGGEAAPSVGNAGGHGNDRTAD
jgi:hypothetical protein